VVELKYSESEANSDFESNIEGGKWIINVKPSATFTTTKFKPIELEEIEEEDFLFQS
jgi:hypothetical protein